MRIGLVDLDTSHPQNWIPILRDLGHEVVGVWDGGSVHPPSYVAKFAADFAIPQVYGSLAELAAVADCAIIHGCDWDTHIAKAAPFVAAGKSVLIDKPLAGNLRDLQQLRQWVQAGARISGGSSLLFAVETQAWLAQPLEERGTPHTVFCGCGVDEFNYGIHAYAMLSGILGSGITRVRHLGKGVQRRILVEWADGRSGVLVIGATAKWMPFYATVVTERAVTYLQADAGKLYRALLEATLPYLAGETDTPPLPVDAWLEPELCALAARQSWLNGDQPVALADLADDAGYDGKVFAEGYRKAKYP
ncbi:MAG: Gfo/Idh/MocA family oxidoreductase [Caldilineaceae bacterium]|nr:Gfo/Idh/MocA family oxidoreductase [Caldilineaceae bacterium]